MATIEKRGSKRARGGGNDCEPAKKDFDKTLRAWADKKEMFGKYDAAYDGLATGNDVLLGRDSPEPTGNKCIKEEPCGILFTTPSKSHWLEGHPRKVVRGDFVAWAQMKVDSQCPSIQIQLGIAEGNRPTRMASVFEIAADHLEAMDHLRVTDSAMDIGNFNELLSKLNLGLLSVDCETTERTNAALSYFAAVNKTEGHDLPGFELLTFKLKTSPRPFLAHDGRTMRAVTAAHEKHVESGTSEDPADRTAREKRYCADFEAPDLQYISVLRKSVPSEVHFANDFWVCQMTRCIKQGIFWGYNLGKDLSQNCDYFMEIVAGKQPAPTLPWMVAATGSSRNFGGDKDGRHDGRQTFSSFDAYQRTMLVALLQDVQCQRNSENTHFLDEVDDIRWHHATMKRPHLADVNLEIIFSTDQGMAKPRVSLGETLVISIMSDDHVECEGAKFTVTSIDLSSSTDCVVQPSNARELVIFDPASCVVNDAQFSVKITRTMNVVSTERALSAVLDLGQNKDMAIKQLLIGNLEDKYVGVSKARDQAFEEAKTALGPNLVDFNKWELDQTMNQFQSWSIRRLETERYPVIQGPPGSGKSTVICTAGLKLAMLGFATLLVAPTNQAILSNVKKLSSTAKTLPAALKSKVTIILMDSSRNVYQSVLASLDYHGLGREESCVLHEELKAVEHLQLWSQLRVFAGVGLPYEQQDHANRHKRDFVEIYEKIKNKAVIRRVDHEALIEAITQLTSDLLQAKWNGLIVLSTCNSSRVFSGFGRMLTFDMIIIDEAALCNDFDLVISAEVPHKALGLVGDHMQLRPHITSKETNAFIKTISKSFLERRMIHTSSPSTMLQISYRFGKEIADLVGTLAQYEGGLAAARKPKSSLFSSFERFLKSSDLFATRQTIFKNSLYAQMEERTNPQHVIGIDVVSAYSTMPMDSKSRQNFASASVVVELITKFCAITQEPGKNVLAISPYRYQSELIKSQLEWSGITGSKTLTVSTSQGVEAPIIVADITICNIEEPANLGFLVKDWQKFNVMLSRPQDVLFVVGNLSAYRSDMEKLKKNTPYLAELVLTLFDNGNVFRISREAVLPANEVEAQSISPWTNRQHLPAVSGNSRLQPAPLDQFTEFELSILKNFRARKAANDLSTARVLEIEEEFKARREDHKGT